VRWLSSCDNNSVDHTHHGFVTEDFFDTRRSAPAPTTLIYGGISPVVTPADAKEAALANPATQPIEVPGAAHMLFWDEPAAAVQHCGSSCSNKSWDQLLALSAAEPFEK
jgi:N-formylmaleamate deformylase